MTMPQEGSAMLGSGSQSCQVMAKTDDAQSIVNILSAIHLKRDILRSALPFQLDAVHTHGRSAAAAALPASRRSLAPTMRLCFRAGANSSAQRRASDANHAQRRA
jgi:hypothetical protein